MREKIEWIAFQVDDGVFGEFEGKFVVVSYKNYKRALKTHPELKSVRIWKLVEVK